MHFSKKILLFSVVLLAALGFTYAVFYPQISPKQNKSREEFKRGLVLFNNYQYSASSDFFLKSLSYDHDFFLARRFLGQSLYLAGRVDEAVEEWKIILEAGGYDPALKLHLQNLNSVKVSTENKLVYSGEIPPERGYNYSYPTFVSSLPDKKLFLLSLGQLDVGNMLVINSNGKFSQNLRRISEKLQMPVAAAVGNDELWVSDMKADKIHRLDLKASEKLRVFNALGAIGASGSGELEFHGPAGICFLDNAFFVVDSSNNRVQKISTDGKFIVSFSKVKAGFELNRPFGIACGEDGSIYVSEPLEKRISKFDRYGNFIDYWGLNILKKPRHLQIDPTGKYLTVADEEEGVFIIKLNTEEVRHIKQYSRKANKPVSFVRPYSAALDHFGNLIVADHGAHNVLLFTPEHFLYSNLEVWIERIYSSSFPLVGVYVSVKDQYGKMVTVLDSDNFKISENNADVGRLGAGYLKKFDLQGSWTICLSKSLMMKDSQDALNWITDFITLKLREKDEIKVISYSDAFREDSEWTSSRLQIQKALHVNQPEDFTNNNLTGLGRALYHSVSKLLDKRGKRAMIWVTEGLLSYDGLSEINLSRLENYAVNNHIPIYVISFENPQNSLYKDHREKIKNFAEKTGGYYFSAYSSELKNIQKLLRKQSEDRYVLSYESPALKEWKGQFVDMQLEVNFQNRTGVETSGYFIPEDR
ncbi:MAG: hypothetical protein OEZ13_10075 [Spirochaetia bacterium]|nr:hypothetical protein [Spirochaetia bacterium]